MSLEGWILIGLLLLIAGVDIVRYYSIRCEIRDMREEVDELRERQDEPQKNNCYGVSTVTSSS